MSIKLVSQITFCGGKGGCTVRGFRRHLTFIAFCSRRHVRDHLSLILHLFDSFANYFNESNANCN